MQKISFFLSFFPRLRRRRARTQRSVTVDRRRRVIITAGGWWLVAGATDADSCASHQRAHRATPRDVVLPPFTACSATERRILYSVRPPADAQR